ncbi:MAG TPA: conjugal transfer protein [Pseudomonas xinjiangensis]|uniref:Conjugal transfer protein n=2 Tax=root TaxID=1 RepID=A0A7V1BRS2_9GAMM|nr:conjugal transfer protein [Halopseudomonas xinjiangensis]HEC46510.1 conjugal transfer protein [Halopseudomonas xinjiangensis]
MTVILDETEIKQVQRDTNLPMQKAVLRADRNRWFVVALGLIVALMMMTGFMWYAFDKANNNKELVYIKLYPDGTSDVSEFRPEDEQLYFRSTIDAGLERFIKARFGQQAETIKRDYAEAAVFMSGPLYNDFIGAHEGGYNAPQKAIDIIASAKNADRIEVTWGFSDHYDKIPAVFNNQSGEMIRSNLYFTQTPKTATGLVKPDGVKRLIMRAQWRLLPKRTLAEKTRAWLRINPVGLEIVDYEVIEDPSSYQLTEDEASK